MPESNESLLANTPSETSINMETPRGGSNKQALKVAGLTLLACVLIAGQAFTAYTVYSQKQQLSTLERRSDRLLDMGSRAMAVRVPVKMNLPMRSMPLAFEDVSTDKKGSSSSTQPAPSVRTQCQKEAAGESKTQLPTFRPKCDDKGNYLAQQCWDGTDICWCVDKNGVEVLNSVTTGPAQCEDTKLAEPVPVKPLLGEKRSSEEAQ